MSENDLLPIGKPRKGSELFIKDGEIFIAGDTVGKGYYENPEKTAEAFIAVSYTHLDVYKRQIPRCFAMSASRRFSSSRPVAVTKASISSIFSSSRRDVSVASP